MDLEHHSAPAWSPEPPPPPTRRRLGPGLLAAAIAVLLLFGGVGLYALRQSNAAAAPGAGSPDAAAAGLLAALDAKRLDQAARFLDGHEALLVGTYRARILDLVAAAGGGGVSVRDARFTRVAGSADVAVLELAGGSVTLSGPGGQSLQLPVDELDKRLAQQTHGAVSAVRLVTVRSGGRWRVDLLASAAEQARLAARGGQPDYQLLAGTAPGKGAASPDAAVRGLAAAVAADPTSAIDWLAPDERAVAAAYRAALLARRPELGLRPGNLRVKDLRLRDEPVAAQVVRVRLLGGQLLLRGLPGAPSSVPLDRAGRQAGATPYVVAVQRGGAWYPSLEFTAADWLVNHPPTRERP